MKQPAGPRGLYGRGRNPMAPDRTKAVEVREQPHEEHRVSRNRRLGLNLRVGFAVRVLNSVIQLALVALLLRVLGSERYGLFVTITSVAAWLQLGMLGAGKGLINAMVEARSNDDHDLARRSMLSLWSGLLLLVAVLGMVAAVVLPQIRWSAVFPAQTVGEAELARTVGLAAAFALVALALSPLGFVLSAHQEDAKGAGLLLARNAATLLAAGLMLEVGSRSMSALTLAIGIGTTVVGAGGVFWLFGIDKPRLRPRAGDVRAALVVRTLRASGTFLALDLAGVLAYQLDRLLVLRTAGAESVTRFELATVLFLLAQSVFGVALMPLWPALGEAYRREDFGWVRRTFSRLVWWSVCGMAAVVVLGVVVGPWAISLWTGRTDVVPDRVLLLTIGCHFVLRTFADCHVVLLYSRNRQGAMLLPVFLNGFLLLVLGLALGRLWGVWGVALANLLAFALTQGWWAPLLGGRELARDRALSVPA